MKKFCASILTVFLWSILFTSELQAEEVPSTLTPDVVVFKYDINDCSICKYGISPEAHIDEAKQYLENKWPNRNVHSCTVDVYDDTWNASGTHGPYGYWHCTVKLTWSSVRDQGGRWRYYREPRYQCPTTHPYIIETYEDDQPKTCSDIEPTCDCTEDLIDNQCVARTPFYPQQDETTKDGVKYLISDENNQGLKCGLPLLEETCASDAVQTPIPWIENPVNCTNGVKRQTETDYASSIGGLRLSRTYSSSAVAEDTLARLYSQSGSSLPSNIQVINYRERADVSYHEWQVEGLPYLNLDTSHSGYTIARLMLPNGSTLTYTKATSETSWSRYSDKEGVLNDNGSGYQFTSANGTVYQFDSSGKLTSKTYRNGQAHTISYPTANQAVITDSFGRSATIYYDDIPQTITTSKRVITKFIDPAGNEYRYEHDSKGYITKVIYPDVTTSDWTDNPFKQYLYNDRTYTKVLTGIIDENGDQFATYGYDGKNRAISTEHAGGAIKATIDYQGIASGQSSVKFYRDSTNYREAVYHNSIYNGVNKVTQLEQKPCLGCTVGDYTYDYDANGFLSQATSPEGDITQFTYNLRGLLESRTEAFGTANQRTVTTTWHSQYKLPLTVDEPQRLTTYSYDANGNLLSRSVKDKTTNETRSVSYTYNSVGQVLTVNGPRTDVSDITTYEYDASGNLTKVINALGHETLITSHDAHGKPLSITDPNGTVTTLTYHPRGWLTTITTDGATTNYDYDNAGQLIAVTMANGIVLNYEYDAAHRLVAIADANGNRIEYTLDNYGNRTRTDIKDSNGVIQSYAQQVFNDLGQLKQTLGANNQVNDFDYDAEGKPVQSEDALNNPTSQQFDELDRLQKVVDPALGETSFDYDNQDRLTSVTDATGKTTSYQYNAFGDLLSMTSPDTGTSTMTYDSAGNVLTATDARNITAIYSYDALNRVTSIDYPGTAEDITFTYDDTASGNKGIGRLTQVTDESGSTSYEYDAKGQLVSETRVINGLSFTTGYQYDAAGLITQVSYPSGRTVDYQRNTLGQVIGATTTANGQTQTLASNINYLPFGPLTNLTYGNGKVLAQSFDQDYRLTSKHTTGLQQLDYGYTPRNNINSISDPLDSTKNQSFSYDALGRLTDASGDYGTQSYTFDGIGNRLSKTEDGETENYVYSSTSHQLQSVGSTNLTYDAIGNTLTKGDLTFTYNQMGRLVTASKTSLNATYSYNAQGQRVKKVVDNGTSTITSLYHYDQSGQLIAETDGQGQLLSEYYYLDGQRVAISSYRAERTTYSDGTDSHLWTVYDNDPSGASATSVTDPETGRAVIQLSGDGTNNGFKLSSANGQDWNDENHFVQWRQKTTKLVMYFLVDTSLGEKLVTYRMKNGHNYIYPENDRYYMIRIGEEFADNSWKMIQRNLLADLRTLSPDIELYRIRHLKVRGTGYIDDVAVGSSNLFQSETLLYIHTDHLGSPLALTDNYGTVQWKGSYDPYGKVTVEVNNLDQNQRFPGQYADEETGLHYNYFRDYDPEIGRYLQSDPIGLNGGINTYGYVGANPLNYIDPYGLELYGAQYANYRAGNNPSYAKASVNDGHYFSEGVMTFVRGHYRNFRHFARSQGWMGSCEELKAAAEGVALQAALDMMMNDEGLQSDANYALWDTLLSNKWRSAGRFAPNLALSAYVSKKTGHPLAGLSASNLSALGSAAGDIRYFVETNGPKIAIDKLGEVTANGNVNVSPEMVNKLLECSCEE